MIQTTQTHRGPAPSVFLQKQDNDPVSGTYFDQRVPVPEEDGEVIYGNTFICEQLHRKTSINKYSLCFMFRCDRTQHSV